MENRVRLFRRGPREKITELSFAARAESKPNPDIVTLLLNFRTHCVALSADIAKAYMTIKLADPDCRLFRFLW